LRKVKAATPSRCSALDVRQVPDLQPPHHADILSTDPSMGKSGDLAAIKNLADWILSR
jgi:hypothetical protein